MKRIYYRLKGFRILLLVGIIFLGTTFVIASGQVNNAPDIEAIDKIITDVMTKGKIPGLSLVLIKGQEHVVAKGYGLADINGQQPVTVGTLFQLASCSKSFTALAMLKLESEGYVKMSDPVSKYFPGFKMTFRDKEYPITIEQLLHHLSGIPWKTFAQIPEAEHEQALEEVVHLVSGTQLNDTPGRKYEYSNTNFDIAGAIIEKVSGMSFENYMKKEVFNPLGMEHTEIGIKGDGNQENANATGHKIAFSEPKPFASPIYRGNFPAGYVLSNANDMAVWLKAQLGMVQTNFTPLMQRSHKPNSLLQGTQYRPVSYSFGWQVRPGVKSVVFHSGMNPNFTSFVAIIPSQQIAIAVLANSNSTGTQFLGQRLLQVLSTGSSPTQIPEQKKAAEYVYNGGLDNFFTIGSYGLIALIVLCIGIILYILIDTFRGLRHFEGMTLNKLFQIFIALMGSAPLLLGIYFVPDAIVGFSWPLALAWAPGSFPVVIYLIIAFFGAANFIFFLSLIFPYKAKSSFRNQYLKPLPLILFLGFIAGLAGAAAMFLISTSFFSPMELKYLLYYFGTALFISTLGQKIVRTKMIVIANDIVFELRMKLVSKIFATRFQHFEKIDSGRIYATLNNDTESISNSASMVVGTVTSAVTAVAAFVYLSAISLLATLSTLMFAVLMGGFYIIVGKKSRVLMEQMRDTQNVFMKLIEGLVKGFREISMHHNKKIEYDADVEASCEEYRRTRVSAIVKFVNANLVSSSMILILLAAICISFPRLFPDMSLARLISFIMVLLYMIGPITSIMSSFPTFIRIKVSWDRIQKFIDEVPAMEELTHYKDIKALSHKGKTVESLEAKGITYSYQGEEGSEPFCVGPIDLKVQKGEILFIVGGNGSGKTTLAKMITGLYQPEQGSVTIDGKEIGGNDYLGEYFSIIFDNFMLFEKLYNIDIEAKKAEIDEYLKVLRMDGKVKLKDGKFSTVDLSSGQRKRLALLQCYLEDCPIYLFDEVAADQDPEFRKFFYHDLLIKMKKQGKIIIAITHDDHYFDVADQIIKLDMGKIDTYVPVLKTNVSS
jgi:cyclic peptide transporter